MTHPGIRDRRKSRAALLALLLIASAGCDSPDRLIASGSTEAPDPTAKAAPPSVSGIPFGAFALPLNLYGPTFTGGHMNASPPESLLSRLAVVRSAGAHVDLTFVGSPVNYTNADGTFNFSMWKSRVDRYAAIDFNSYIADGTIIGHYLIDEPQCSSCWGGEPVPPDTLEAMAQYSKQYWPTMITIVRAAPTWLAGYPGQYVYLDAGWAQYTYLQGDVNSYLADNVAAAQSKGLGLIVGLNLLKGGPNLTSLTATQVKTLGSVLLGSPYACAFISWQYNADYFSRTDIASALDALSKKAKRHAASPCQQ